MDIFRVLFPSIFLLVLWTNFVTSVVTHDLHRTHTNHTQITAHPNKRAYGSFVDGLSIAIGLGSLIMGVTCTETGGCSPDVITEKIEALNSKVDNIQSQISTLQREVAEIRQDVLTKWYLDFIKFVSSQLTKVSAETLAHSTNQLDVAFRDKFVDQNLGIHRDDYVYKALFLIPKLVKDDKVVEHYLRYQRNEGVEDTEAVKRTCDFAKGILDYQDDGYTSLLIAYSIKFIDEPSTYNLALAETCALWRTEGSPEYTNKCNSLESQLPEGYEDRRQPQKDYILSIEGLAGCSLDNPPPEST